MTKFVFMNVPLHAHINPTLAVVQELVARGDEVIYYLTEKYRGPIEATGARFRAYTSLIEQEQATQQPSYAPVMPMRMVEECLFVLPQVLEVVRADYPDCIIYDPMCLSGRFAAQILGIPAAISRPTFVVHERVMRSMQGQQRNAEASRIFQQSMQQLCAQYAIKPFEISDIFRHKEAMNIVYIPRSFQIDGESYGDEYLFVGPSLGPRCNPAVFPFEQLGSQPIIYITLGTVYNTDPTFFQTCFAALHDLPWQVVVATGRPVEELQVGPVPDNVILRSYVPQLEILEHTGVFVGHGGMSTIMEAISRGVPMVVIPHAAAQVANAQRVMDLGLGLMLEKESMTVDSLRAAVLQILHNPEYRTRARLVQEDARACGGFMAAADALQRFVAVPV